MSLYNHCKLLASIVQYKNPFYNKEVALSKETTKSYNELKLTNYAFSVYKRRVAKSGHRTRKNFSYSALVTVPSHWNQVIRVAEKINDDQIDTFLLYICFNICRLVSFYVQIYIQAPQRYRIHQS